MNIDQTGAIEQEYVGWCKKERTKVLRKLALYERLESRLFTAIDFAESAGPDSEAKKLQKQARQHRVHPDQLVTGATVLAGLIG